MKVNKSNTVTVELEDEDTCRDLLIALADIPNSAPVRWIPLGHNRPGLLFNLSED